ncbi:hypothetical protein OAK47_03320, partial [Planctomycetaceae bacterium]|nr:hypothetical protein [Planctomycetaceae bacterium]
TFVAYSQVSIGSHNLKDIITQTNCPNLYWALATIPEPFVSIEEVLENEASLAEKSFPILREPEHTDRSVEGWSRLMRETIEVLVAFGAVYDHPIIDPALVGFAVSIRSYPIAKRELITLGWKQEKLEKMPVGQVVAIYQKHITLSLFDEALKWSYLPDLELKNSERLRREQDRLNQERKKQSEPFPIATTLLPAHAQLRAAALRSKSRIHGLMVLEAIRMHAAENHGQLPQSLDEITVVPVPKECPLTGEPFEYRTTKGDAFLIVPTVPENIGRRSWWEFQLKNAERTQEKR